MMNIKKHITIFLAAALFCCKLSAQENYADSLRAAVQTSTNDTQLLVLYSLMAHQSVSYDSSLLYSMKECTLAKRLGYKLDQAYALDQAGYAMGSLRNPQALAKLFEAATLAEDAGSEKNILPGPYWAANIYYDTIQDPAFPKNPRNIRLRILASTYQDMAHVYNGSDLNKGLAYYFKAADVAKTVNDNYSLIIVYQSIGSSYYHLNKPDSALYYYQEAYNLGESTSLQKLSRLTLYFMANIYSAQKKFTLAKAYAQRAITALAEYSYPPGLIISYQVLSKYYSSAGNIDSSLYYAKLAYQNARQINRVSLILDAGNNLAAVYSAANKPDSAYKYLALLYKLRDSLYSAERFKEAQQIEINEQEKQRDLAESKQQYQNRLRTYLLVGGLAALLIILVIVIRNNIYRRKAFGLLQKQKAETDRQKIKVENTLAELQSTQAQLIQSEKMASLGELTAGIAHEIQNPLNFVNNFSEVNTELIEDLQGERRKAEGEKDESLEDEIINDIKQNLEKINHHGKRADAIVKGMLQHSRQSSGKKEPTDINALCDEYLRLAYHGLRAKDKEFNAMLQTDFDESIGKINIVPQDIGRVLLNLFNNAFYATKEKLQSASGGHKPQAGNIAYFPTVTIVTKKLNNSIEIKVEDNGSGIPSTIKDKIFQPFFTTKPTGSGTGLGLSLAYDIIKAHGHLAST
ncbi:MAG TPA: ATP-binding protein [Parafilimonas sp.]|nr:ATP-binding protein [Parafilimonas sp.]